MVGTDPFEHEPPGERPRHGTRTGAALASWMATSRTASRVLTGLVLVAVALTLLVARPFFGSLLVAAVLAGTLMPVQRRLALGNPRRARWIAVFLTSGILFAVLLPATTIVGYAVAQGIEAAKAIQDALKGPGVSSIVSRLPDWAEPRAQQLLDTIKRIDAEMIGRQLAGHGAQAGAVFGAIVAATGSAFSFGLRFVLMFIALYMFLVDGPRLVRWLEDVVPLRPGQTRDLLHEFRVASAAVVRSSLLTALVQAAVALVGFFIARAPAPLFFALCTFVLALIPAIGGAAGCLVVSLILLATGHPWSALFLALWGVLIVGLSDNIVKPIFIRGGLEIHGGAIFFALLGGLAAFGALGLIVGPLVLAFLVAIVRISKEDEQLRALESWTPPRPPPSDDQPPITRS